jgi:response regulator RpfG family c-di-GMP phosphodiesterase
MALSTEQLLRTADTLEKALSEIALLPSHARTHEQEIFFDLYRNGAIKSFELSLETAGKLLRKALKAFNASPRTDGPYTTQLNEKIIETMFLVAPLHDIGKVGIPDSVLLKPDALNAEEWSVMKTHAMIGETILQAAIDGDQKHAQLLQTAVEIAGGHHEKWNGSGYPRGFSGQQIPLAARIMSVADMYDALVSTRVYKTKWTHDQAIDEIKRQSGEYFDPVVVQAFLSIQDQVQAIATAYADAESPN